MDTVNVDIKLSYYTTEQNQWRFDFSGPKDIARSYMTQRVRQHFNLPVGYFYENIDKQSPW